MATPNFSTLNSFIRANFKHTLIPGICERSFGLLPAPCGTLHPSFGVLLSSSARFADCALIQNRRSKIANLDTPWCNGNTAPFGGVILGSNPSGVATLVIGRFTYESRGSLRLQRDATKRTKSQSIWQVFVKPMQLP